MSDIDPAGRVQLTLDPALPATCLICSRSSDGKINFVDFNLNFDYYGAVVICEDCIRECLQVVENKKVALLQDEVNSLRHDLSVAEGKINAYAAAFDGISLIRPDIVSVDSGDDLGSEESPETENSGQSDVFESVDGGTEDESDSDGQNSSGGLENFSIFANQQ